MGKGARGDFHVNVNVPNGLGFGHWKAINICQHSIMELSYLTLAGTPFFTVFFFFCHL